MILRGATRIGRGHPDRHAAARSSTPRSAATAGSWPASWSRRRSRTRVQIGPFAHLRPGSSIGTGAKLGNYAEVKNSRLEAGVQQHHMSYLGDAQVGRPDEHRGGHDHRQLRRQAQETDDDRDRRVHRRRHDAGRPGRAGRRAPGPAPAPSSTATCRRASWRSACRPGCATRGPSPRTHRPDDRHPPAPGHRRPDAPRGLLRVGRDLDRLDPPQPPRPAVRGRQSPGPPGPPAEGRSGPLPGRGPARPDRPRLLRLGLRRGQPERRACQLHAPGPRRRRRRDRPADRDRPAGPVHDRLRRARPQVDRAGLRRAPVDAGRRSDRVDRPGPRPDRVVPDPGHQRDHPDPRREHVERRPDDAPRSSS